MQVQNLTRVEFRSKLIGSEYNGLYLPASGSVDSMPKKSSLATYRRNALKRVEDLARDWIRNELLPEMSEFDYSTMYSALLQVDVPDEEVLVDQGGSKKTRKMKKQETPTEQKGKINKDRCAGYMWNAIGLFFRRGVYDNVYFPPGEKSLANSRVLGYTMWDALQEKFRGTGGVVDEVGGQMGGEGNGKMGEGVRL